MSVATTGSPRVFYLNIQRRQDRRNQLERVLDACDLLAASERVEALDGKALARQPGALAAACKDAVASAQLSALSRRESNPDIAGDAHLDAAGKRHRFVYAG